MLDPEVDFRELQLPYCSFDELEKRLSQENVWGTFTTRAIQQALASHGSVTRDSGQPYLEEHVFPVTVNVLDYLVERGASQSRKEVAATGALLHDTVEDDPEYDLEACERQFDLRVSRLVYPLTRYGIDHDIYIKKLENASEDVKIIKLFDRLNNLQCSVVLASALPSKLIEYLFDTEINYLHLAGMLIDKTLYERMQELIYAGHAALGSLKAKP